MPTTTRKVLCAGCNRPNLDLGTRQTCAYCGTSPLPSYHYPQGCGFHPTDCDCCVGAPPPVDRAAIAAKAPPRRAGAPRLRY